MSFKKNILKKYVGDSEILYIIGHSSLEYVKLINIYSILLFILFGLYWLLDHYILEIPFLVNLFFGIVGLIMYGRFIISFMDIYLDAIIVTNNGIVMFKWDGIMKYSNETINWNGILSIYEDQNGLFDIIMNEGDLKFKTPGSIYTFNNVHNPRYQKEKIIKIQKDLKDSDKKEPELDKFDVLVETLGEVIIDYVKKSKN